MNQVISKESVMLILVVNAIVAFLYLVIGLIVSRVKKGDWKKRIFTFLVLMLCPVAGPLIVFSSYVFYKVFFREEVNLADVIFNKDKVKVLQRANYDMESNFVPIEEALAVSDHRSLRGLMLDVLKGDVGSNLGSIALALSGSDSETAHYAASVLRDELSDFRTHVTQQYQELKGGSDKALANGRNLIVYMSRMLEQKVFSEMEQEAFVSILDHVGDILYGSRRETMTISHMESIGLRLLEVEDFEGCDKWCQRCLEVFGDELASYTLYMKLLFTQGKGEDMFKVMNTLKNSDIEMDQATLEMIRTFRQEG